MEAALEQVLNLLLESERAGVVVLEELSRQVTNQPLRRFLSAASANESANVKSLEELLRSAGGKPSEQIGPFVDKVAALDSVRDKLNLLSRGQAWVAQKVEQALALAPAAGPIHQFLLSMANHHRHEVEWGRAEVIRLMRDEEK